MIFVKSEAKQLLVMFFIAVILASLPVVFFTAFAPPGHEYSGALMADMDTETYFAKMRIPAELGTWGWTNWYDPEFNGKPVPLFLFYDTSPGKPAFLRVG